MDSSTGAEGEEEVTGGNTEKGKGIVEDSAEFCFIDEDSDQEVYQEKGASSYAGTDATGTQGSGLGGGGNEGSEKPDKAGVSGGDKAGETGGGKGLIHH